MAQILYVVAYLASATDPADDATGHAQIKNGQDGSGAAAAWSGSTTWAGPSTYLDTSGLSAGTLYATAAVVYDDVALTYSNRVLATETLLHLAVPAAALELSAAIPTVAVSANQTVAVPAAATQLAAIAPVVVTTGSQIISVPAGTLQLAGVAPSVVASAHQTVAVPVGTLQLAAAVPTITVAADKIIQIPVAALTTSGAAPSIGLSGNVPVGAPVGISLTAYAPTVTGDAPIQTVYQGPLSFSYPGKTGKRKKPKKPEPTLAEQIREELEAQLAEAEKPHPVEEVPEDRNEVEEEREESVESAVAEPLDEPAEIEPFGQVVEAVPLREGEPEERLASQLATLDALIGRLEAHEKALVRSRRRLAQQRLLLM